MDTLSVVIPVYNSAEILPLLIKRLHPVLASIAERYELILVNDASADHSWEVIKTLTTEHEWIRGVNLMRNYGQHNALLAGIHLAQNEIIVTMDDDLQHDPQHIPDLLAELANGYDVVYGTPEQERHGLLRDFSSQITKWVLHQSMQIDIAREVSAYRVFRTELRKAFKNYNAPYISIDVLLTWGTTRFSSIKIPHAERYSGASNYTFRKLVRHALNMLTGYSTVPLRFASYMGFIFTLFGIGVLAFVLINYLINGSAVAGFAFTVSTIAIFAGAQLFALGIIGEYMARMYLRIMDRPAYSIREQIK